MASVMVMMTPMLVFIFHVSPSYSQTMDARDYAALTAVRKAIENKEKFPAIQCSPISDHGPFSCDASGRVKVISIPYGELKGKIAAEIGNLTYLTGLDLTVNQLSGSIPSSFGKLTSLKNIDLSSNQLSGSIPWSIGQMKSLSVLWLYRNKLSGIIPSSIGQLTSLKELHLLGNQLSGRIPSSFGKLTSLREILLDENQLSGSIPSSMSQLTYLYSFGIQNNYFTGPIIQKNGEPLCYELAGNCLFGSNLPKACDPSKQRSQSTCLSFCNATQKGGPCGGNGVCSKRANGISACACNKGYTDKGSKYTCKLPRRPPPRRPSSPRRPPPRRSSPPRRPPPRRP